MSEEKPEKNPAVWKFASTNGKEAELLKDALREVKDPELGYSVIDLGLSRNVVLAENRLLITMILTTPFCPYGAQLVEQVRQTAEKAVKYDVAMDLRFDPWDQSMMEDGFDLDWGIY